MCRVHEWKKINIKEKKLEMVLKPGNTSRKKTLYKYITEENSGMCLALYSILKNSFLCIKIHIHIKMIKLLKPPLSLLLLLCSSIRLEFFQLFFFFDLFMSLLLEQQNFFQANQCEINGKNEQSIIKSKELQVWPCFRSTRDSVGVSICMCALASFLYHSKTIFYRMNFAHRFVCIHFFLLLSSSTILSAPSV